MGTGRPVKDATARAKWWATMNNRERAIAFGTHSKIPRCCIQFFIDEWDRERDLKTVYHRLIGYSTYNYVPCPECFATGNKVKIVECEIECKRECWKDF